MTTRSSRPLYLSSSDTDNAASSAKPIWANSGELRRVALRRVRREPGSRGPSPQDRGRARPSRAAEVAALGLDLRGLVELHRAVVIPGVALARRLGVREGRGPRPDVLRAMLLWGLRVRLVIIDRERLDQQRDGAAPRVDEARVLDGTRQGVPRKSQPRVAAHEAPVARVERELVRVVGLGVDEPL